MRRGFAHTELVIMLTILAVLLAFAVPKFILLMHKAQEGHTKHELVRVRSAIAAYYGEHEGMYPTDDLSSLVPAYIEKMPQAKVPGFAPTAHVTAGNYETCFTKTGGWSYVNDAQDPHFGDFVVNVDAKDSYGKPWQSH